MSKISKNDITSIPGHINFDNISFSDSYIRTLKFIESLGNKEYRIKEVNMQRDFDLWRMLFSLNIKTAYSSINDQNMMINSLYSEIPVYITFLDQEDESLFLLTFKNYEPT